MKVRFSPDGFEQDHSPQLCVEGTFSELEYLVQIIEQFITSNKQGEIMKIGSHAEHCIEISLINNRYDNRLISKVNDNFFIISLDVMLWKEFVDILQPICSIRGYQFIEMNSKSVVEDLGLIFMSI